MNYNMLIRYTDSNIKTRPFVYRYKAYLLVYHMQTSASISIKTIDISKLINFS